MLKEPVSRLIILNDEAQVLMLSSLSAGPWQLPQATILTGETAVDSAIRAALEQAKVHIQDMECIGYSSAPDEQTVSVNGASLRHCLIFVSTLWAAAESVGDNIVLKWFPVAELPRLEDNQTATMALFKTWLDHRQFIIR